VSVPQIFYRFAPAPIVGEFTACQVSLATAKSNPGTRVVLHADGFSLMTSIVVPRIRVVRAPDFEVENTPDLGNVPGATDSSCSAGLKK
jgi:hypothetical protein